MIVGKCYNQFTDYVMKDGASLMWTRDRSQALDMDAKTASEMAPRLELKYNNLYRHDGKVWTEEK